MSAAEHKIEGWPAGWTLEVEPLIPAVVTATLTPPGGFPISTSTTTVEGAADALVALAHEQDPRFRSWIAKGRGRKAESRRSLARAIIEVGER